METKFTKGEWKAVVHDGELKHAVIYIPNGGFDISNCPDSVANAQLIAAAPELYEEIEQDIKELVELLKGLYQHGDDYIFYSNKLKGKQKLLAKARGEQ